MSQRTRDDPRESDTIRPMLTPRVEMRCPPFKSLASLNAFLRTALQSAKNLHKLTFVPHVFERNSHFVISITVFSPEAPSVISMLQLAELAPDVHVFKKGKPKDSLGVVFAGSSEDRQLPVDVVQYKCTQVQDCNQPINEAFTHAGLHHANICEVMQITILQTKRGWKTRTIREATKRSLAADLRERRQLHSPYAEVQLMSLLHQLSHATLFAQRLAPRSMELTHAWLSLDRIFITANGVFRVWGFRVEESGDAEDTVVIEPGAAQKEVTLALGELMVQLATLSVDKPAQPLAAIPGLPYSKPLKDVFRYMLADDPLSISDLAAMLSAQFRPSSLPVLHSPLPDISTAQLAQARLLKEQRLYAEASKLYAEVYETLHAQGEKKAAIEAGTELAHLKAVRESDFVAAEAIFARNEVFAAHRTNAMRLVELECAYFMRDPRRTKSLVATLSQQTLSEDEHCTVLFYATEASHYFPHLHPASSALSQLLELYLAAKDKDRCKEWSEAYALRRAIEGRVSQVGTDGCFPVRLFTASNAADLALTLVGLERMAEAIEEFAKADAILQMDYPRSWLTGQNLYNWGKALHLMHKLEEGLQKYAAAESIFVAWHPTCLDCALTLTNYAISLASLHQTAPALDKYAKAESLLSSHYPNSRERAINAVNYARLLKRTQRAHESIQWLTLACSLFTRFPSALYGHSLYRLGKALAAEKRWSDAIPHFARAQQVDTSLTGKTLLHWGLALEASGDVQAAAEKYDAAIATSCTVESVREWANELFALGKYEKAGRKYEQIHDMIAEHPTTVTLLAQNLYNWANALSATGALAESVHKHAQADEILTLHRLSPLLTAQNLLNWARVLCLSTNFAEAAPKLTRAQSLLSDEHLHSKDFARVQMCRSVVLVKSSDTHSALSLCESVNQLLSDHFPLCVEVGQNLLNWGNVLCAAQMFSAACEKYADADRFLTAHFPESRDRGVNLTNWGNACADAGDLVVAEGKYRAANKCLETRFGKEAQSNLDNWYIVRSLMGRKTDRRSK